MYTGRRTWADYSSSLEGFFLWHWQREMSSSGWGTSSIPSRTLGLLDWRLAYSWNVYLKATERLVHTSVPTAPYLYFSSSCVVSDSNQWLIPFACIWTWVAINSSAIFENLASDPGTQFYVLVGIGKQGGRAYSSCLNEQLSGSAPLVKWMTGFVGYTNQQRKMISFSKSSQRTRQVSPGGRRLHIFNNGDRPLFDMLSHPRHGPRHSYKSDISFMGSVHI